MVAYWVYFVSVIYLTVLIRAFIDVQRKTVSKHDNMIRVMRKGVFGHMWKVYLQISLHISAVWFERYVIRWWVNMTQFHGIEESLALKSDIADAQIDILYVRRTIFEWRVTYVSIPQCTFCTPCAHEKSRFKTNTVQDVDVVVVVPFLLCKAKT